VYPFAKEEHLQRYVEVENILPRVRYEGPFKKHIDIADFYGFRLIAPVKIDKDDRSSRGPSERVAFLRTYLEEGLDTCTPPIQVCHTSKVPYNQEIQVLQEYHKNGSDFLQREMMLREVYFGQFLYSVHLDRKRYSKDRAGLHLCSAHQRNQYFFYNAQ